MKQKRKAQSAIFTLHCHDARELDTLLEKLGDEQVTATITSPPYGSLKDYGHPAQIGHGQSYEDYLGAMEGVFEQIFRHTAEDGSLWLIADTYIEKGRAPRRLLPVPFDLATSAESCGWTLRDVIVWEKDRTLPWSNGTRLRNAFEYVLLLVKGPQSKYRLDRLRSHEGLREWWVRFPERYSPEGKAPTNVWRVPIPRQGSWANGEIDHACPLPPELVRRLILLSSDENDVILDPFAGSGVVLAEAERLGRRAIGAELVGRHVEEFERIVRPEVLSRTNGAGPSVNGASAELLIKLRMLKLPVVLLRAAAKLPEPIPWPLAVVVLPKRAAAQKSHGGARLSFVVATKSTAQRRRARKTLEGLAARPPASKFGIEADIEVIGEEDLPRAIAGRRIYAYQKGATSRGKGPVPHRQLAEQLAGGEAIPPVLSPLFVNVSPRPEEEIAGPR